MSLPLDSFAAVLVHSFECVFQENGHCRFISISFTFKLCCLFANDNLVSFSKILYSQYICTESDTNCLMSLFKMHRWN